MIGVKGGGRGGGGLGGRRDENGRNRREPLRFRFLLCAFALPAYSATQTQHWGAVLIGRSVCHTVGDRQDSVSGDSDVQSFLGAVSDCSSMNHNS